MKTKQNKTVAAIILVAVIMATSSCQKEKLTPTVKKSENTTLARETFSDIQAALMFEVTRNLSFKTENCGTITDDTISVPHVRTIDYGTGCIDDDGKVRKGQMIITYDADDIKTTAGANAYTTFNVFFIDDIEVTGTFNMHNNGLNGNGNYTYTTIGKFEQILPNNEGTLSVDGQQEIEWISGDNTPDVSDDEYAHTGSLTGVLPTGETMSITIVQPLIEKRNCEGYYVSGEELIQVTGESDLYLNYGDGTCDNIAVKTVDGVPQTITLD